MHDTEFWNRYIKKNSDKFEQIVKKNYPQKKNFNEVFHFTNKRVVRRLVEADQKYAKSDGKMGAENTDTYFYHQTKFVVQSYDWSKLVERNFYVIEEMVNKRCSRSEREEIFSEVYKKILHNDYRILRLKEKKSIKPENYLKMQVQNKIKETLYKKCKPPKWIRKHYDFLFWNIYRRLCCSKNNKDDIIYEFIQIGHKDSVIEDVLEIIQKKYPKCGASNKIINDTEGIPDFPGFPDYLGDEENEDAKIKQKIINIILNGDYEKNYEDHIIIQKLKKKLKSLRIQPENMHLLKLQYCEKMKPREIAEKMGMSKDQVYGRIRPVRKKLEKLGTYLIKAVKDIKKITIL